MLVAVSFFFLVIDWLCVIEQEKEVDAVDSSWTTTDSSDTQFGSEDISFEVRDTFWSKFER